MPRRLLIFTICLVIASISIMLAPHPVLAQSYITIVVQPGDSLGKLANRYCTNWRAIYDINRQTIGPNPNQMEVGMVLTIPSGCGGVVTPPIADGVYDRGARDHASGYYQSPYYTVSWGDTYFSIAARFGLSVAALQQANGGSALQTGQTLFIPGSGGGALRPQPQPSAGNAERVYFGVGGTSATQTGVIANAAPKRYILGAGGGQSIELNTQSHGSALTVSVMGTDGRILALNGENGGISNHLWGRLPATGDYIITIIPMGLPESPQMAFDIAFVIQ